MYLFILEERAAIASGLIDRVCQSLKEEGIAYETLGGVVPNPRLSKVREGIALCREKKIDFILAVGGGSVIDSAKAIGYGVANEGCVWVLRKKTCADRMSSDWCGAYHCSSRK